MDFFPGSSLVFTSCEGDSSILTPFRQAPTHSQELLKPITRSTTLRPRTVSHCNERTIMPATNWTPFHSTEPQLHTERSSPHGPRAAVAARRHAEASSPAHTPSMRWLVSAFKIRKRSLVDEISRLSYAGGAGGCVRSFGGVTARDGRADRPELNEDYETCAREVAHGP